MAVTQITVSGQISASPQQVYDLLADYRNGHPKILPAAYFRRLEVLKGGVGAGTHTRVEMRAMGSTRVFFHEILEPEPGRVLMERETPQGSVTTFTVEPRQGGQATYLTIYTELPAQKGITANLFGWMTQGFLRRVYTEEIANIAAYFAQGVLAASGKPEPR